MPLFQCYYFTLFGLILLTIPYFKALLKVNEEHITNIFSIGVYVEEGVRSKNHGVLIHFV